MSDAGFTMSRDAPSRPGSMISDSGALMAGRVTVEADRLDGPLKGGVETARDAARDAARADGDVVGDVYAKMVQDVMRSGIDVTLHLFALMRARCPSDAYRIHVDFMQKHFLSTQGRLFAVMGLKRPAGER